MGSSSQQCLDRITDSDVVLAVLGITGSGKSTFISTLTNLDIGIGHNLAPKTTEIGIYSFLQESGRRVYLIDTPGFDDDVHSDIDVLREQVFLFTQLYRTGASLIGLVYLHPITKNRVDGSAMRNFRMLEQMCGLGALDRLVLLTTMWDQIDLGTPRHIDASRRQQELLDDAHFWGTMCRYGSQAMQFDEGRQSALQVIDAITDKFIQHGPVAFQIQREIVDKGKDLWMTSAARELDRELVRIKRDCDKNLGQVIDLFKQAEKKRSHESALRLTKEKDGLEQSLMDITEAHKQLQTSFETIRTEKEARFAHTLEEISREHQSLAHDIRDEFSRLQRLEEEKQESTAIYRSYYQSERHESTISSRVSYIDESFEKSYHEDQQQILQSKSKLEKSVKSKKRRKVLIQNIVPMLQILGGVGCVAGGAATMIIPVAAVGATLITAGMSGLNFSTKKKDKDESGANDYTSAFEIP
ncbi:hypothetical protein O1611_g969 [Lasiodiplodia mahajangana]|uniref:Uncharacterized protein n=1 Tax=Lasiodiplodia mahajangana TaxID=1108764 RepID=A0ACC2JYP5_9PEZI|nr:hypothetical protein O1611_g969 [Lasiodiplodia mahajangana]